MAVRYVSLGDVKEVKMVLDLYYFCYLAEVAIGNQSLCII